MLQSISTHETRLSDVQVVVALSEIEKFNTVSNTAEMKKKVEIRLKGLVKKTGEPYSFTASLFLSPLSLD